MAVCIPARGDAAGLQRVLCSIAEGTVRTMVVVAVDGPDPSLVRVAEEHGARVTVLEEQRGSYAARNAAVDLVLDDVDIVCFTDSDAEVAPDWVRAHCHALEAGDLCGGAVRHDLSTPPTPAEHVDAFRNLNQRRYVEVVGFAATANLAVKAAVLRTIRFDASLRSGGDRDFCERALAAGFVLVYSDDAWIRHRARRTAWSLFRKTWRVARGRSRVHRLRPESIDFAPDPRGSAVRAGRELGRSQGAWWDLRVMVLDRSCTALLALGAPSSIPGAVQRRLRRRR